MIARLRRGQALVEIMVGMAITAAIMPALVTSYFAARGGGAQEQVRMQASGRLREAREALRLIKTASWSNVETDGTYHLTQSNGLWGIASGSETNLDNLFTREIVLSPSYRTLTNQLTTASAGNTLDPSVKHVTITVSWNSPIASSVVSDYYLMRLENLTWLQTTVADFTLGVQTGTAITNNSGGEIVLGSGGAGLSDWCEPELTFASVDLPKNGVANAVSASVGTGASPNQIVAGTGDNSSGISLGHVQVTNANPPQGSLEGSFDGYKTNGVYVSGDLALIGTDNNAKEVVMIDLSSLDPVTGKYQESGTFNAPGNGNGSAVGLAGSIGFVTVGAKLYSFNADSGALLGSVDLTGAGSKLMVSGSYVYVAESSPSRTLEIIQFNEGATTLTVVGWISLGGEFGAGITLNSTSSRAYLATVQGKVYILDTTVPDQGALPPPLGIYDTSGMTPKGIVVVTNNKMIVVGTGGSLQYQVIDIVNEGAPVPCGGLEITSGVNGISSVQEEDGDTYSYIITGDATSELKIIQGGGGGGGGVYTSDGSFESSIFDAGYSVMFNRFETTASAPPPDTEIRYQVAITSPVGDCAGASYTYVGPDLTPNSYFTGSTPLPLGTAVGYSNPGQCLKYKVRLTTTNNNSTPILYDLTFNYSP